MNTDLKGEICEGIAIVKLMKLGYIISKPVNKCKYDLIADDGNRLLRIQVKKGTVKENFIKFNTSSVNTKTNKSIQYTNEEIDYFLIINLETETVYVIHVNECSKGEQRFRFTKPKNNQQKKILFADNYLLENYNMQK